MPKILDRLVKQLKDKGFNEGSAYAIATSSLQKSGNLKKGTRVATKKGVERGNMTPAERAKDRAVKAYGGKTSDYKYKAKSNSVVKVKKSGKSK